MNKTQKWLLSVPGKKKWYIAALTLIQALSGGASVLFALLLRNIVDSAVARDQMLLRQNVLKIVLLVVFQIGLHALNRWLKELSRTDIENIFKRRLNDQILKKDFAAVSARHTGDWLNRLTSDTAVVARAYTEILPGLIGTVVKLVSALVMILALDTWFAYILIPGGLLLIVLTYAFRGKLKSLHKNIQEKDGKLRIFLQEHISGLMMIKSFTAEKHTSELAADHMQEHKAARMKRNHFANFASTGLAFAMNGMYLIGIVYCAVGILNGTVSYGTLTAIMHLIAQIQSPFATVSGYLPRYYAMLASAERLMEIEEYADDIASGPVSRTEADRFYHEELSAFGLRNAEFTYLPAITEGTGLSKENMPTVLHGISLSIYKGEYVAFTGHSGCGKSTVLKLLLCMYPLDSGERFLSCSDGTERPLTPEWRRLFAYVPQGNQLMSGTIRDIVAFAEPEKANDAERISLALHIACADEFIAELEDGIDTMLGERGAGLSEGQMQRIAIARAIFAGDPILLLDEATSALDEKTEQRLLTNLRSLTDKTVVIVTHRRAALSICDRVLEFTEDGVIEAADR